MRNYLFRKSLCISVLTVYAMDNLEMKLKWEFLGYSDFAVCRATKRTKFLISNSGSSRVDGRVFLWRVDSSSSAFAFNEHFPSSVDAKRLSLGKDAPRCSPRHALPVSFARLQSKDPASNSDELEQGVFSVVFFSILWHFGLLRTTADFYTETFNVERSINILQMKIR